MFKILQKFLPEIINLLLTFYLQAQQYGWIPYRNMIGYEKEEPER